MDRFGDMKVNRLGIFGILFLCAFLKASIAYASSSAGITYNGRLVSPSGQPVDGIVEFRLQIRSPNTGNCLLFQETKTVNLTGKNGYFTLTLNDGNGLILTGSYALDRVFANQGKFEVTHPNLDCGGSNEYTPNPTDGRKLKVSFKDTTLNDWEQLPSMDINFVPTAVESVQVGGFKASQLLRVQDNSGVPQTVTPFTTTEFASLLDLVDGTSNAYVKSSMAVGLPAPVVSGNPSSAAAGSMWFDSVTGKLKYHDGTTVQTLGTSGGSVSSVAAGTGLTTGGSPITSTGTIGIANSGVDTLQIKDGAVTSAKLNSSGVTAGVYGSGTKIPVITVDAQGRLTLASEASITGILPSGTNGEYLKSNGVAWASARIEIADIKSTGAGHPSFFNFSAACTLDKTLVYDSVNDRMNCTSIGINANQVTAGTLDKARLPSEAVLDGGNSVSAAMTVGTTSGQPLKLLTSNTPQVTLSSTGNLGVGTETPIEKLQLEGRFFQTNDAVNYPYADRLAYFNIFLNTLNRQHANSFDGNVYTVYNRVHAQVTDTTASKYTGSAMALAVSVNPMISNSGYARGLYTAAVRNSLAAQDDSGTLGAIYGNTVQYGHLVGNASSTPTTTTVYGLQMLPALSSGSIGTLFDIHIKSLPAASNVTTHYGLYQEDLEARNYFGGKLGLGVSSPSAVLQLKAGTATAGTAPLKFTTGTLLTTPENGSVEYDGADLYLTTGGSRRKLASSSTTGDYTGVGSITGSGALNVSAGGTNQNLLLSGSGTGQVQSSSVFHVTNTTASTSTTTGAMIVDGGLGVSGAVNADSLAATTSLMTPVIYGSTASMGTLTLQSTTNANRGDLLLNPSGGLIKMGTNSASSGSYVFSPNATVQSYMRFVSDANANYIQSGVNETIGSAKDLRFGPSFTTTPWMTIGSTGNVGIGTMSPSYPLDVSINNSPVIYAGSFIAKGSDANATRTLNAENFHTSTTTAATDTIAAKIFSHPIISSGQGNSGQHSGLWSGIFRNNIASGGDSGTAGAVVGNYLQYGHNNIDASATPVTNNVYGILLSPYSRSGTVTNFYDIYIAADAGGTGVTNRYGIYQAGSGTNFFNGKVGMGTSKPNANGLEVARDTYVEIRSSRYSEDNNPSYFDMFKARGTMASPAAAQNGDYMGTVRWMSYVDSSNTSSISATIASKVEGAAVATKHPSSLRFGTTNSSGAIGERMILDPTGNLGIGTLTPLYGIGYNSSSRVLSVGGSGSDVTGSYGVITIGNNRATAANNDNLGILDFVSANNSGSKIGSRLISVNQGTGGANGFGAYLSFQTKEDNGALTEKLRIAADGNIGIGTSSPSALLDVRGNINIGNQGRIIGDFSNADPSKRTYFQTATTNGNTYVSVTPNGTAGNASFSANNSSDILNAAYMATGITSTKAYIHSNANGTGSVLPLVFQTATVDRMTITQGGSVGIGITAPTEKLEVNGGNLKVVGVATCILGSAAGGVNCTSDERLKDNVEVIPRALEKISQLRGVGFDWNQKASTPGRHDIGVIAQEVEKVFPTLIHVDKASGYKMVDYAGLVSPLIESTKELYGMCRASEVKAERLEREIASLKEENIQIKQESADLKKRLEVQEKMLQEIRSRLGM